VSVTPHFRSASRTRFSSSASIGEDPDWRISRPLPLPLAVTAARYRGPSSTAVSVFVIRVYRPPAFWAAGVGPSSGS
jgi:hypothetical protein